jgi:hypothetical protein
VAVNSQNVFLALADGPSGDLVFSELVSISIDGIQADNVEITPRTSPYRTKAFRPADRDDGTLSVVMRAQNQLSSAYVGTTTSLAIYKNGSGAGTYWTGLAIIQSLAWRASVGELQEYAVTFKLGATT